MKEINIPFLRRGIDHWANIQDATDRIEYYVSKDTDFFFDEFSVNEILKASSLLYKKISNVLLEHIEKCIKQNEKAGNDDLEIDDIIVSDSDFINDIIADVFSEKKYISYSQEYKRVCDYVSLCANAMFSFYPMGRGFPVYLIQEIGEDYILVAGISKNPKYRNKLYENYIYVISNKYNSNLIDFFTNRRELYDYDEYEPYTSIVNLCIHTFYNMDYLTVDLIEDEKRGWAEAYSCNISHKDEDCDDFYENY